VAIDEGSDQDPDAEHQRARRPQDAEQARDPQRRYRERGQPLDREPDQRAEVPNGAPMGALGRSVIDDELPFGCSQRPWRADRSDRATDLHQDARSPGISFRDRVGNQ
jgi:hypothetical protein